MKLKALLIPLALYAQFAFGAITFVGNGTMDATVASVTATPTVPASATTGDLLLVSTWLIGDAAGEAHTTPAGYTLLESVTNNGTGESVVLNLYCKVHDGTEATPDIAPTGENTGDANGAKITAFRSVGGGFDCSDIVAHTAEVGTAAATNLAHPARTITTDNTLLVAFGVKRACENCVFSTLATNSFSWAQLWHTNGTAGDDWSLAEDYVIQTTATNLSAGSWTATAGDESQISAAIVLSLKQALPTFTAGPTAGTPTGEAVAITFTSSQTGTVYGVACPDGQASPTVAQVVAGTCTGDVPAVSLFAEPVTQGGADSSTFVGLTAATTYDTHYAIVGVGGNSAAIASVANQTTAGAAGISFTDGPEVTGILNGYQIDYTTSSNAYVYAVGCNPGDAAPTATEIQAAQCGGGNTAPMSANKVTASGVADSFNMTAAGSTVRHNVYVVAAASNPVANVEVYATIAGHASARWQCTVNGAISPVLFVVNDWGEANNAELSDRNHWTQFSSTTWPVLVVCATRGGTVSTASDVTAAEIRPLRFGITPTIDTALDSVSFVINEPGQYFVKADNAQEDPLFVFASTVDATKPVVNGTTVKAYSAGMDMTGVQKVVFQSGNIYDLDTAYPQGDPDGGGPLVACSTSDNTACVRTPLQVKYGVEYYIEGGAWVDGQLELTCGNGTGVFKLRGRGTLTGEQYRPNKEVQAYRMIYDIGNCTTGSQVYDGFTVALTPRQIMVIRDAAFSANDVKLMGFTGDGITMTNGSTVTNSFFKLNDDSFKPFASNTTATNNVIYLQKTGVGILLSWGSSGDLSNVLVDGVDVIESTRATYSASPGNYTQGDSSPCITNTIAGIQNMKGGHIHNVTYKNVRMDVPMWMIWQFKNKGCLSGFIDGQNSEISDITFENWSGPDAEQPSIFNGNGTNPGTLHDFHFINVELGGVDLTSSDIGVTGGSNPGTVGKMLVCSEATESCTDSSSTFTFAP